MRTDAIRRNRLMVLAVLIPGTAAWAFNPQPEPPPQFGFDWRIEGFVDMLADTYVPTDNNMPFGLPRTIADDPDVDFSAGLIAGFDAPDSNGDMMPDDGLYEGHLMLFDLTIGDTMWDQTMDNAMPMIQVRNGLVIGLAFTYTDTMPSHPDLTFELPSSPGLWQAVDEVDGDSKGMIGGTYSLRDGIVPEPASLVGGLLGLVAIAGRRRRST